ncbi:MAG: ATP-binding cassette domain-containing protein, partial [Candidatus Methanomethylophilaceae archaeon]|nr:ATP-binding cassette domain-containing protein [Candidatus Methanomethylophilaceae archaeon]
MALLGGLSSACSTVATPESNDQEIGLLMARDDNVAISKKLQLESLLQEYSQDKITPAEYQARRVAIIGKNGSGKSSILKLINGDDIKFTGNFMLASGLKISYIS